MRLKLHFLRLALSGLAVFAGAVAQGQMVTGENMPGFGPVFGLEPKNRAQGLVVREIGISAGTNVLWPGESGEIDYAITNSRSTARKVVGHLRVIGYRTSVAVGDVWVPRVFKVSDQQDAAFSLQLGPKETVRWKVRPSVPGRFGAYGLVFDLGKEGRVWGGTVARSLRPTTTKEKDPACSMDMPWPFEISEPVARTFNKLGVRGCRMGASYTPTTSPEFENSLKELGQHLEWCKQNNVTVMLTIGAGSAPQPLGRGRPWLKQDGTLIEGVKEDLSWLPAYDDDFRKWTRIVCERWGWPRGPVNAVELWNEPWEGVSISGWGADMIRYRDIYRQMGNGVLDARKLGRTVMIGGASSSSNTLDKLFPDGSDEFLGMLDFVSIHYQGPGATPCLVPNWMNRKGPYGKVQVWDTESWVANSEDRVSGVIASMFSFGQDRALGSYGGNTFTAESHDLDGKNHRVVQVWSVAPAVAASAEFIGRRKFKSLLFPHGLPWVYEFNGLKNVEDGTFVVLGNLGHLYNPNSVLYRGAHQQLAKKPGLLRLKQNSLYSVFDHSGNPVKPANGFVSIPLSSEGFYVRGSGKPGSIAAARKAIQGAEISGVPPVEITVRDLLAAPGSGTSMRVTVTNLLNRPTKGYVRVKIAGTQLPNGTNLVIPSNSERIISVPIAGLPQRGDNAYPASIEWVPVGGSPIQLNETVHANVIASSTIHVDGVLDDWAGVLPQTVSGEGLRASLTEEAWLPFKARTNSATAALATGYLSADENGLYFAARITDPTPYPGNIRFENRKDDDYFYPEVAYIESATEGAFAVRWTGDLVAPKSGLYTLATVSDDGVRLWIDGKLVIDNWSDHGAATDRAFVKLEAGKPVSLKLEYFQGGGGAKLDLRWENEQGELVIVPQSAFPKGLKADYFADRALTSPMFSTVDDRLEKSLGDQFPARPSGQTNRRPIRWPEGVRQFSYRKDPDLPAGIQTDNVQIAFNVLPDAKKYWLPRPPGVMPRYMHYPDTDYEFALNSVAPQFGGGTEVWRLFAPGAPRKHFYPRQPKAPIDGGPVKSAKLEIRREGNLRIVEAFLPWSELPEVKKSRDTGGTIKFSFRVNDNDGPAYELAQGRSASKENGLAFHNDWVTHWANEIEFAFAPRNPK